MGSIDKAERAAPVTGVESHSLRRQGFVRARWLGLAPIGLLAALTLGGCGAKNGPAANAAKVPVRPTPSPRATKVAFRNMSDSLQASAENSFSLRPYPPFFHTGAM